MGYKIYTTARYMVKANARNEIESLKMRHVDVCVWWFLFMSIFRKKDGKASYKLDNALTG